MNTTTTTTTTTTMMMMMIVKSCTIVTIHFFIVVILIVIICAAIFKPLGSGKVRLVQQPFPYLPWHLSAPEQSRSQVREGATRITVFLKLLEVRVVGLRSRQESNSIWVRRNSLVTQSLNHSLHVRVTENVLTRGQ